MNYLWPYLRPQYRLVSLLVLMSILTAGVTLLQPFIIQNIIKTASATGQLNWAMVFTLFGVLLLVAVLKGAQLYGLSVIAENVIYGARRVIIRKFSTIPISEYDRHQKGDLVSRLSSDTTLLRSAIAGGVTDVVGSSFLIVGAIIALFIIDPVLTAASMGVLAVTALVSIAAAKRIGGLSHSAQTQMGALVSSTERYVGGVRTIRASGAETAEIESVVRKSSEVRQAGLRIARTNSLLSPINTISGYLVIMIVIGWGGYRVASGTVQLADLVTFMFLLFVLIGPMGQIFAAITSLGNAAGAARRIQEVVDLKDDVEPAAARPREGGLTNTSIEFRNVSFSYDSGKQVVDELSLIAAHGKLTALVGPSGAGKSTVLALIERFYEPGSGAIFIGGEPITDFSKEYLRQQIAYVDQAAQILAGTLKDNLTLGLGTPSDQDCMKALQQVNLSNLVDRAPKGLHAPVGDSGVLLSGGEKQRLSLARAILSGRPIILLDEPTAALDANNEEAFQEALRSVSGERTIIVVAHRLATVADADCIHVLESGKLSAQGSHHELLQISPLYREMSAKQYLSI